MKYTDCRGRWKELLLPGIFLLGLAPSLSAQGSVDEQVKRLARRYEQVEAQLERSVRYSHTEAAGAESTIEQAWVNGAGDVIKVATEKKAPGRRELTEYFALNFDDAGAALFILNRQETAQPDGSTQVDEAREYYGASPDPHGDNVDVPLRAQTKSARFKPDEPLEMAHVPNKVVNLPPSPPEWTGDEPEQARARYAFFNRPQEIAEALLKAGPPELDPFAQVTGDAEKYRVIHGTASPDGRYAIALGFSKEVNWEQLADPDTPGTFTGGDYDYDAKEAAASDAGQTLNYVVELATRRILGQTGGGYFGTRSRYNLRACDVYWSPDSMNFAELTTEKWNYVTCTAGRIGAGPKLLGPVDLGKRAEKEAASFQKKHRAKVSGSIAISVSGVTNDGVISLEVIGQQASGEHKGDVDFSVDESLRLRETPAGLTLETVSARKGKLE